MRARRGRKNHHHQRSRTSLRLQWLEDRIVPDGLSLLGHWDNGTARYSDGWADDRGDRQIAYIGHYQNNNGMHLIDVTDPANPWLVSTFFSDTQYNDFRDVETVKIGQRWIGLFSSDSGGGLFIVDVTDPANPVQLSRITPSQGGTSTVHTLSVSGHLLFEADSRTDTVRVFDISVPEQPTWLRNIISQTGDDVHEVTVLGGRMYTANIWGAGTAEVWDVSQIEQAGHPATYLGVAPTGYMTHTSWPTRDGRYMAVAREAKGGELSFWDLQNPGSPQLLWKIRTPTSEAWCVHQVTIQGNYLYASWYQQGVFVFDISNKQEPALVGHYDTFGGTIDQSFPYQGAWGVFPYLGRNRVLVFDLQTGMYIFEFDPGRGVPSMSLRQEAPGKYVVEGTDEPSERPTSLRDVPIGTNVQLIGGVLRVLLDDSGNDVKISRDAVTQTFDVVIDGTERYSLPAAEVRQINIYGGKGDDDFTFGPNLNSYVYLDGGGGWNTADGWPTITTNGVHSVSGLVNGTYVHGQKGSPAYATHIQVRKSASASLGTVLSTHSLHGFGGASFGRPITQNSNSVVTGDHSQLLSGVGAMFTGGQMASTMGALHSGGTIAPELMVRTSVNSQVGGQVAYHKPG